VTARRRTSVTWAKDDPFGAETAEVFLAADCLTATGVAIGGAPVPYRLDYALQTRSGWVTTAVRACARGDGWRRWLELERAAFGAWTVRAESEGADGLAPAGGEPDALAGATDADLGLSPLFNSLPVLRHGLLASGGPHDFVVAWISVPDLTLRPSAQRYTHRRTLADGGACVRFESEDFAADIRFDAAGLVLDYPGIARRL
jgi:uncharacterized protein